MESGDTKRVADFYSTDYGSLSERKSIVNYKKVLQFISYNPSSQKIIFNLFAENDGAQARLDFFSLKLGEGKTDYHYLFRNVSTFADMGDVQFLGWYLSK